jgi:signal transduction protein with GAF and PtsI domain
VYLDAPKTKQGKPYKSILALPIIFEKRVLGAVSIDSKESYHFEGHVDDLEVQLAPYVQLLAPTLARDVALAEQRHHDHANNSAGFGELPAGSEEKFDGSNTQDQ